MQGVVDNNYRFTDVSVKLPGITHDATILKESDLYKNSEHMIPTFTKLHHDIKVPLFLVGNPAHPLLPWLMKPYIEIHTFDEESFNCHLSSTQNVIKITFRRLKGRWGCLAKRIDVKPSFVPQVVLACAILHNFVEEQKESFSDSWDLSHQCNSEYPQPREENLTDSLSEDNIQAKDMRTVLRRYLKENVK
ncbi:protein ALP1-like [Drosophila innubila]|uniref:protein ALP1-like n=1 Tax=Drosophila innubila TaxID=198719 RepID=UPI00148D139C|nr:protein ALP1-like [Drosophila innubila]